MIVRGALLLVSAMLTPSALGAQPRLTNAIGMEFVAIPAGTMLVGKFQPVCPKPQPKAADQTGDPRAQWNADDHRRCQEMVKHEAMPRITVKSPQKNHTGIG